MSVAKATSLPENYPYQFNLRFTQDQNGNWFAQIDTAKGWTMWTSTFTTIREAAHQGIAMFEQEGRS